MSTILDLCFLCIKDHNCVPVDNIIVSQVEYLLPEITITKLGIPLRICSVCYEALYAFSTFKQFCMESSRRLEACIKGAQSSGALGPPQTQLAPGRVSENINLHTDTNIDNAEEEVIKKEILEDTQGHESCESILNNKLLEPCSSLKHNTEGGSVAIDICAPSVVKSEMIEEIFIKDEPLDEPPENMNVYKFECTLKEEKEDYITEHDIEPKCATLNTSETCNIKPNMEICNNMFQNTLDENSLTKQYTETESATLHTTETYDTIPEKTEQIFITEPLYHNPQVFQKTLEENNINQQSENVSETITNKYKQLYNYKFLNTFGENSTNNEVETVPGKICNGTSAELQKVKTNSGGKIFQCEICPKSFTHKNNFNQHMNIHNGVKDFSCEICHKSFTQKGHLGYHMKMHSGIKDFACSICIKSFRTKSKLNLHMKLHSGVKDHPCSVCEKVFPCLSRLNQHMKYHSGVRNYQCGLCSKSFIQKVHFDHHMKVHSGVKDFPCSVCNKAFVSRSAVNQHMKIHS